MESTFNNIAISVSDFISFVKNQLENDFIDIWIKGEISNLIISSAGHYYFNLKDKNAQLKCVLFKGMAFRLKPNIKDGDEIELSGKLTIYSARGDLQLIVENINKLGFGALYAEFEKLKEKLTKEGIFNNEKKKPRPRYPKTIGIITSPVSAAIKDVISTIKRRMPSINIIVYPTAVQGKGVEMDIAKTINTASARQEVDVLILCRGGGSIEDLWCFNEEAVVMAIYTCKIPLISGVGHETDFTLADFVSDIRAPTPTGAAEIATPSKEELLKLINFKEKLINRKIKDKYYETSQNLDYLIRLMLDINTYLNLKRNQVNEYNKKLPILIKHKEYQYKEKLNNIINKFEKRAININEYKHEVLKIEDTLINYFNNLLIEKKNKLNFYTKILEVISPQKILERGFSIVEDNKKHIISNVDVLKNNQTILITFAKGKTKAMVFKDDKQNDLFD